jgi:hypothetical protein
MIINEIETPVEDVSPEPICIVTLRLLLINATASIFMVEYKNKPVIWEVPA